MAKRGEEGERGDRGLDAVLWKRLDVGQTSSLMVRTSELVNGGMNRGGGVKSARVVDTEGNCHTAPGSNGGFFHQPGRIHALFVWCSAL